MNFYQSNHFDDQRADFQNTTTNERLDKKLNQMFTPKSYFQRWRHFNAGAIALSYICNLLSAITAFAVLSFLLFRSFGAVFPSVVSVLLSAVVAFGAVAILETMKRFSTANFLKRIFQEKKTSTMLLVLVVVCCGCSVGASFYGAKNIPHLTKQPPIEAQAETTNKDSIRQFYAGLIGTKQQSIDSYRPTIATSGTARKTVAKLENEISSLHLRMEKALQQATTKDSTTQATIARQNQQATAAFQASNEAEGLTLGWVALSFEIVFLLCLIFNWSFYWHCYVERASVGVAQGNQLFTQQLQSATIDTQQPTNEGDQQRPTVVKGFLDGLQRQKKGTTNAVITDAVKYTRRCDNCSAPFMHKVHNQRFCSEKCRVKAWEKKTGRALKKKQKGARLAQSQQKGAS